MRIGQQARNLRPQRSFWPGAGRGANLDLISKALTRAGTVVVLTGGGAMGKTRLALEAMARVEAASIPCRTVAGNGHDDLNAIIDEIARLPEPRSTDTKTRALLVVDQAEDAGARTLERLILIAGKTSIAVMLVGRAELVGTLVRSVPEQVCDLVTRYVALEPLDTDQTAEFVAHCLGDEATPVTCGTDALRRIAAHSHGVPGIVDRLMTDAVRLARLSRSARLTATVIDMIADDEHPPAEGSVSEPPEPPVPSFRRKGKPVATAQPAAQQSVVRQTADGTRSMQAVLTGLHETPAFPYGHDDDHDDLDYRDPDGPDWPKPSANLLQPPARPARRIPPWAGGIAFVVVATSAIALQHYLQTGAPILTPADGSRTVVSSLLGDAGMRPASPPAVRTTETAQTAPPADAITMPPVMAEAVAEPSPESPGTQSSTIQTPTIQPPAEQPRAEMVPEPEMVLPAPPAPAESVLSEPELPNLENEAIAPAEPEAVPEEAVPTEQAAPAPPAPTAESPVEQAPADTATESAPSDAVEPPVPETPAAEISPPTEPAPSEPVVSEPAPLEPPAAVAVPEPAPPEPTPEQAAPPAPESEPTLAEPTPSPAPESEPTLAEPTPSPAPESEPTLAEPTPQPAPEPEPTLAEPTPQPAPEPEPTLAEPTPQPAPEPAPTVAEPAPQPVPAPEPPAPAEAVVTAAPPPPPPPPSPNPVPATPRPSSVAESVLLERGDRLLALGDVASARLLYETAAAGGSARGALLAGRTLDPAYLRSLGTRGVAGDPARAADWYEKAAKLGDDSATAHLEALGRR